MKRSLLIGFLVVALFIAGGFVYSSLCACVTLAQVGHDALTAANGQALGAQQTFFEQHGRYARTVAELGYLPDSTIALQIVPTSDSIVEMSSTFLPMPEVSCSLDVRPGITSLSGLVCTR